VVVHFTYGWLNPAFAYVLSVVGALVGLHCMTKARNCDDPRQRGWLLVFGAGALGGTGIWAMQFMAMIGFSVSGTAVRYDLTPAAASALIAVLVSGCGLFVLGYGEPSRARLLVAGAVVGAGVAVAHYSAMAAVRLNGQVGYDTGLVVLSYLVGIFLATLALWCTAVRTGPAATVTAATVMGAAACATHYTGMAAVRVAQAEPTAPVPGVTANWFLFPIVVLVLLTVVVAVAAAMLAIPAAELAVSDLPGEPTLDVRSAAGTRSTLDLRRFANGGSANTGVGSANTGVGSRFVPRSSGAGRGLWAPRGNAGRAGARPAGR
jgi:NO-binding membrane sensor protein with MHYT domain